MSTNILYLYCVVSAERVPRPRRLPAGVPGAAVPRLVQAADRLWVVAADAPASRYGERELGRGLKDLEWLSRCALGHEAVVEHFARRLPVVPFKLFTLFLSEERALAHVRRERRRIARTLRHVTGCDEWGVRLMLEAAARPVDGGRPRPIRSRESGTHFLMRKQRLLAAARASAARGPAAAEALFRRLARHARAARRRDPGEVPAARNRLLLDAAYLVPSGRSRSFRAEVRRVARELAPAGHRVSLTGPWPPYNFVEETAYHEDTKDTKNTKDAKGAKDAKIPRRRSTRRLRSA